MVYAIGLGPIAARRGGSIPLIRTRGDSTSVKCTNILVQHANRETRNRTVFVHSKGSIVLASESVQVLS